MLSLYLFVDYLLRRSDAERACRELDGFDWGGHILRTGWGKAMPMPPGHKPQFGMKNLFLGFVMLNSYTPFSVL
jgi:U2-associated protein SR140